MSDDCVQCRANGVVIAWERNGHDVLTAVWRAFSPLTGRYIGTVYSDGDLAFQGELFKYGSPAIAAQALVFKANGVKR